MYKLTEVVGLVRYETNCWQIKEELRCHNRAYLQEKLDAKETGWCLPVY